MNNLWSDAMLIELSILGYELWLAQAAERDGIPPSDVRLAQVQSELRRARSAMIDGAKVQEFAAGYAGLHDEYFHRLPRPMDMSVVLRIERKKQGGPIE